MGSKRQSGSIRKLQSGRFQARVRDTATGAMVSLGTFVTKADADIAIALASADKLRGGWVDPRRGTQVFGSYALAWLDLRPKPLRPRTRETYNSLLKCHILPTFGSMELSAITIETVRSWHARLVNKGPGAMTAAKAYRLLRTIMGTAFSDELIAKNPCCIKGAGKEVSPERPVVSPEDVWALIDAIEPAFRLFLLFATFTSLRFGEIRALRRRDVDLLRVKVCVTEQVQQVAGQGAVRMPPKTEAGVRTLAIPEPVIEYLEVHLANYAQSGPDGLLFASARGGPARPGTIYKAWRKAKSVAGVDDEVRPHDLRHTGNVWAAMETKSLKELMARMGHSTVDAALRYQHATEARDEEIAAGVARRGARPATTSTGQIVSLTRSTGEAVS